MAWIGGIVVWAILLNIAAWLLTIDLSWRVVALVCLMEVISKLIDKIAEA